MLSKRKSIISIALALIAFTLVFLIASVPAVFAQTIDGNLVGTVVDASGAIVPNAMVEVTNTATGIKTTGKTGPDGLYRFNNLPVGTHDVSVTRAVQSYPAPASK